MMFRALFVALVCAASVPAFAGSDPLTEAEREIARDSSRMTVAVAAVMFSSYPGSYEDAGPALYFAKPLWLGQRHRYLQWELDVGVLAGVGSQSRHGHVGVGPRFGVNVYLGSMLGFEMQIGPAFIAQLGRRQVAGVGIFASGGYVFRLWKDDRRRLKLLVIMYNGGYFAPDPGNDLGLNANALGMSIGYETSF